MIDNKGRVAQATPQGGKGGRKDEKDEQSNAISDTIVA